jgi:hypothetical protein
MTASRTKPPQRRVRLTVPLFRSDFETTGRHALSESVVLAELDDREQQRVLKYWDRVDSLAVRLAPKWRLEVHDVSVPDDLYASVDPAGNVVRRLMALLACSVPQAPYWPAVMLDQHDGEHWVRWTWAWHSGGDPHSNATVTADRIAAWRDLIQNWRPDSPRSPVEIALNYYYESVVDTRTDARKALVSAAIAQEVLLGQDVQAEQRYRLSQRGAVLTSRGEHGMKVLRELRRLYDVRSRLVHRGSNPPETDVNKMHLFLMRALPSLGYLRVESGSFEAAVALLDDAAFGRSPSLEALFETPGGWWTSVDVPTALTNNS